MCRLKLAASCRGREEEAGDVMSKFIEKYVRRPIEAISGYEKEVEDRHGKKHIKLMDLHAKYESEKITLQLGAFISEIVRAEVQNLGEEEDDENK